jgi:hypothetical protein
MRGLRGVSQTTPNYDMRHVANRDSFLTLNEDCRSVKNEVRTEGQRRMKYACRVGRYYRTSMSGRYG